MKRLLALVLVLASAHAHAGWSAGPVRLKNLHFMPNGVVIAYVEGTRANVPACAAVESQRFAVNATTPAGRTQLAGLLVAYSADRQVNIFGTGTCSAWGDTETIEFFHTID